MTDNTKSILSDATMIASGTAGAYFLAYCHERGYASYYEIPNELINVNTINLLAFGGLFFGLVMATFPILNLLPVVTVKLPPYLSFYITRTILALIFLVLLPLMFLGTHQWWNWLVPLVMITVVGFLYLGVPLIIHRKKRGILERYAAQDEIESNATPDLAQHFTRRFGANSFLIIVLFLASAQISTFSGIAEAKNQRKFLVTNTSPEMIVLKIYGENLICAPLERETKEIKTEFKILKIAEDPSLELRLENIGPLNPADHSETQNSRSN